MGLYRIRVTHDQHTLAPQDRVSMTYGIESADAPDVADLTQLTTDWVNALNAVVNGGTLRSVLAGSLNPIALEAYPAAGGPVIAVAAFTQASRAGSGNNGFPSEVAMAVSQMTLTVRGVRPKGRTFFGPLGSGAGSSSTARPVVQVRDRLVAFAVAWHNALVARGFTPCVLNHAGTAKVGNITGYRVDDAWDVQRSRGLDPLVYTQQSV